MLLLALLIYCYFLFKKMHLGLRAIQFRAKRILHKDVCATQKGISLQGIDYLLRCKEFDGI